MAKRIPATTRKEAQRLTAVWQGWCARNDQTIDSSFYEQVEESYDALVDYIEAEDLNYTELDPRGPYVPYDN